MGAVTSGRQTDAHSHSHTSLTRCLAQGEEAAVGTTVGTGHDCEAPAGDAAPPTANQIRSRQGPSRPAVVGPSATHTGRAQELVCDPGPRF